jgi:hypothetical protein
MQAFFTLVERHDGKLEEDILQQISSLNWERWRDLYLNYYKIDPRVFIQKVWQCYWIASKESIIDIYNTRFR